MKPYYEHAGITIYHGDCREILPLCSSVELVLTDPPWHIEGLSKAPMRTTTPHGRGKAERLRTYGNGETREIMQGNSDSVRLWGEVAPLLRADRLLLWLPCHSDPRCYLDPLGDWPYLRTVYLRRCIPGYFGRVLMDGEIIHALGQWPKAAKGKMVIPGGMEITYQKADRPNGHPGPRSLVATKWLLRWWTNVDRDGVVCDPFMGSGTTLVAAKYHGLQAIGIEVEERYCELAAQRLSQEVLPMSACHPSEPFAMELA